MSAVEEQVEVIVPIVEKGKIGIRKPSVEDIEHFERCLAADPYHPNSTPEFWMSPTGEAYTFYDEDGNRVYVRVEKVLRLHMEHDPETPRRKQIKLISAVHAYFRDKGAQAGFVELIFDSVAPQLVAFCKKYFGFVSACRPEDHVSNWIERIK